MEIRRIAVFGAGVMGAGIAQDAAAHGLEVVLVDQTEDRLTRAHQSIENSLNLELQRWGITGSEKKILLSHIKFTLNRRDVGSVDLVIEAIPDDLVAKQELFAQLEAQFEQTCPGEVTYVSNTAILPITDIALKMVNKERLVGMHFLAPVPAIKLVEMVRGAHTSQVTVDRAKGNWHAAWTRPPSTCLRTQATSRRALSFPLSTKPSCSTRKERLARRISMSPCALVSVSTRARLPLPTRSDWISSSGGQSTSSASLARLDIVHRSSSGTWLDVGTSE